MKKIVLGLGLIFMAGSAKAVSFNDALSSFIQESSFSFLSGGFVAAGIDVNNGTPVTVSGTHLFDGPVGIDVGMANPLDKSRVGTPVIAGSVHFGRLLKIFAPETFAKIQSLAPNTTQNFFDYFYMGAGGNYNFNVQENEKALMLTWYGGFDIKFGN